jgi:hypothetical protein
LALHDRVAGEPRVQVHDVRLETLGVEGALHPPDEVTGYLLE